MRAVAVFPDEKRIGVIDHPAPALEHDSDVLVDILDVGVCGTDKEIARFDYGQPPPGSAYLVIGHESLGRVARAGSAVTTVAPGDLVVAMVRRPCPHADCRACRVGRQDFCLTGDFTERGIKARHGYMTEQIVDDARYFHRVPRELRAVGVLVEPLTIAQKALIQYGDMQDRLPWRQQGSADGSGSRGVVLGAGPVGLLGALALLVRGFDTWVYSREPDDSETARWIASVGGHYVSSSTVDVAALAARVGNIDLVYEATGASELAFRALTALGIDGVFCFTGVPGRKAPIEVDTDALMRKMVLGNQLVFGTVNAGPDAFAAAIADLAKFVARWPSQVGALITGRFAPEDAPSLLGGSSRGIKNCVSFE